MACNYQFRLVQKAVADLDGILFYLSRQLGNSPAATRFLDELNAAIEEVCTFPGSGFPLDNEFSPHPNIRKKLVGSYILYYLPNTEEQTVYILRIVYGRRNLDEILREMQLS